MPKTHTGACLCKAVQLTTQLAHTHYHTCHCNMCRTWNSGPQFAVPAGTAVQWSGADNIKSYSSSEWAERGFCAECGTHLFYRVKADQSYYLSLGILENTDHFTMDAQLCTDAMPSHYAFSNHCKMLTTQALHALFSDA